jgi:hypothetical protein
MTKIPAARTRVGMKMGFMGFSISLIAIRKIGSPAGGTAGDPYRTVNGVINCPAHKRRIIICGLSGKLIYSKVKGSQRFGSCQKRVSYEGIGDPCRTERQNTKGLPSLRTTAISRELHRAVTVLRGFLLSTASVVHA